MFRATGGLRENIVNFHQESVSLSVFQHRVKEKNGSKNDCEKCEENKKELTDLRSTFDSMKNALNVHIPPQTPTETFLFDKGATVS